MILTYFWAITTDLTLNMSGIMQFNFFQTICRCYSEPELFTNNLVAEAGKITLLSYPPLTGMI